MNEWTWLPAGAVTTQRREVIKLEDETRYTTMGVRWYGKGAYDRGVGTTESIKAKALFRARAGDFVFNRIDTQKGAFDVVPPALDGALATNEFPLYAVDSNRLLPRFLLLYFQQDFVLSQIATMRTGSEGRSRWKEADFEAWPVPLPALAEQRRIVDVIAAVDAYADANAEEATRVRVSYGALLRSLAESAPLRPIADVVDAAFAGGTPSRGRGDFYGGSIPWLKSGEVDSDCIETTHERITDAGLKGSSAKMVPVGATVVAMYGQGDTKGKAGLVATPVATNQAVLALVPDERVVSPGFLVHAVRSQTQALRDRAVGAAQPNLSKRLVLEHRIPVPESLQEQVVFASTASVLREEATTLTAEHVALRAFRACLVAALMNQEIEIPESYDALLPLGA